MLVYPVYKQNYNNINFKKPSKTKLFTYKETISSYMLYFMDITSKYYN